MQFLSLDKIYVILVCREDIYGRYRIQKNEHFFLMTITANYGPVEKFFIFCCLEQKTRPRFLRNWHFFFTFLAPEKPRHVTLILHSLRWRLSWIRSIAGAGNDLGKRANLNFPYTLGGFLKSVLVVSFTLENGVFDKFFHDKFSKTTIALIRFHLY